MNWQFWKAILILPGFALVYAPAVILWLTGSGQREAWIAGGDRYVLMFGVLLLVIGLALMVWTMRLFSQARSGGTIAPWIPVADFIVTGPYRYMRNPMLSGVNLVLAAESLLLQSVPLLIWLIFFVCLNTVFFIWREEPELEQRYGARYVRYKQAVPRWLPRLSPYEDQH